MTLVRKLAHAGLGLDDQVLLTGNDGLASRICGFSLISEMGEKSWITSKGSVLNTTGSTVLSKAIASP